MGHAAKRWTLEEVHSLPDDGNKYELIDGELFVTPPPSYEHETILARLSRVLEPYIASNDLGFLYTPRAVVRIAGSEVEPDRMVRRAMPKEGRDWDDAPIPLLVVEVSSGPTRRRDLREKRTFYMEAGIEEYWIVDPENRNTRVVRSERADAVISEVLTGSPSGADERLRVVVPTLFSDFE
jgi:Uma2 family endonuclease